MIQDLFRLQELTFLQMLYSCSILVLYCSSPKAITIPPHMLASIGPKIICQLDQIPIGGKMNSLVPRVLSLPRGRERTNITNITNIMITKNITIKASDHSNANPRPGQYLTHAHSHITQAVAAMDSCFGLGRPHQHDIL